MEGSLIAQDQFANFTVTSRFGLKYFAIESISIARDLHKLLVGNFCRAKQQKASSHAFMADGAYFDPVAVFHDRDNGNHSSFDEVDVLNLLVGLVNYLFDLEIEAF